MTDEHEHVETEAVPGTPVRLSGTEQKLVRRRVGLRAAVVHEVIRREGINELRRSPWALGWSGIAAGLSMGFSMVAEGLLKSSLPHADWAPLISKLGYSVGFLLVVLGRQQLYTENTLTVVLPLLADRSRSTLTSVLRLWAIVLAANLIGAAVFAFAAARTNIFDASTKLAFAQIGVESVRSGFATTALRGVWAGWLIAMMVWMMPAAESARVSIIVLTTYILALAGLAHVVAGSVETMYAAFDGAASWSEYLRFVAAAFVGNTLGGVTLVAILNHAQVAAGGVEEPY